MRVKELNHNFSTVLKKMPVARASFLNVATHAEGVVSTVLKDKHKKCRVLNHRQIVQTQKKRTLSFCLEGFVFNRHIMGTVEKSVKGFRRTARMYVH